ncbi:MAG: DUF3570 domain-containing protein [Candidatus Eisenbacteria bacterium]|uniref:DUF3570 domain-containing protein n=1 Tax=Eiseniibacteriota bacterium TaxID=2212470 RepID=A0A956RNZ2_UNCEI|nr:DUF3570 domain-containing protein [Candidatus Eisenbacteria bacterium]
MHVVAYLIASGVALAIPSFADPFEVEDQEATYLFRFFSDADKVHVSSHYGFYDVALQNDWKLGLRYNHEQVTVPGVAAPAGSAEAVDAITTASRPISGEDAYQDFTKVRNEVRASLDRGPAHVGYYVSKESDYFAQQVDGEWTQSLAQDNTYLSGGGSYGWDRITPLADQDTATPDDHRNTTHGSLILTQLLSATTVVRLGGELERVEGLQHNPYRNVYAGGGPVPERHPSTRNRRDAFLRLSQYFRNRSSVQIDYRYYTDDWGVQSQTVGAKLNQYVGPNVVVRYRYRYYDQGAADFYRAEYVLADGIDGYRTGDYRLRPIQAHLFGGMLEVGLAAIPATPQWLRSSRLTLSYERYFNDINFSANVFETGLSVDF